MLVRALLSGPVMTTTRFDMILGRQRMLSVLNAAAAFTFASTLCVSILALL
jgi:hypothetical protein